MGQMGSLVVLLALEDSVPKRSVHVAVAQLRAVQGPWGWRGQSYSVSPSHCTLVTP